jgi:hypothetical protein
MFDVSIECARHGGPNRSVAIASAASVYAKGVYARGCDVLIDAPRASDALYLEPCDAADPSQQFAGLGTLLRPGGVSALRNRGSGLCARPDGEGCQNPVCVGPCTGNAARFKYDAGTEELALVGLGQTKCLDANGGIGPDLDFYACHNTSHADQANQRFCIDAELGRLRSRSSGQCVAARSAPGRQHKPLLPQDSSGWTQLVEVCRSQKPHQTLSKVAVS